jgi:hypothetical protein
LLELLFKIREFPKRTSMPHEQLFRNILRGFSTECNECSLIENYGKEKLKNFRLDLLNQG